MKKTRWFSLLSLCIALCMMFMTACAGSSGGTDGGASEEGSGDSSESAEAAVNEWGLADGTYVVDVSTSHAMFHINEANHGKGILTVANGEMTVHISLTSQKIVNVFYGKKEDAKKEGADLIEPTVDTVTYDDGMSDEVFGFDIPVPALDEPFAVAIIGTHGNWYDHELVVSNPVPGDNIRDVVGWPVTLDDGEYQADVVLEGGSGKASIESPAKLVVRDGEATLTVTWSSEYYDYMLVDDVRYEPVNTEGNSVFEIPVSVLGAPFPVIGDTTAMSEPHEIEYTITCTVGD